MIIEPFPIDLNRVSQSIHHLYVEGILAASLIRLDHDLIRSDLTVTVEYGTDGVTWTPLTKQNEGVATAGWYFAESDRDAAYSLEAGAAIYRGIRLNADGLSTVNAQWLRVTYVTLGDYIEVPDLWKPYQRMYTVNQVGGVPRLRVLAVKNGDSAGVVRLYNKTDATLEVVGFSINPESVNRLNGLPIPVHTYGDLDGFVGLTPHRKVFATTDGNITQDENSFSGTDRKFYVGYAISATTINVDLREALQGAASGLNAEFFRGYTVEQVKQGRNLLVNGCHRFGQRGASFTVTTGVNRYVLDQWRLDVAGTGASVAASRENFTVGQTDVLPREACFFQRLNVTNGGDATNGKVLYQQFVVDVRLGANEQTIVQFYAKADAAKTVAVSFMQMFGTGGSPSASVTTPIQKINLTTSWQLFTLPISLPSIAGKTIGSDGRHTSAVVLQLWLSAGTVFNTETGTLGIQTGVFDFASVQWEKGPVATAFDWRPEAFELELCQYFYEKSYELDVAPGTVSSVNVWDSTVTSQGAGLVKAWIPFKVPKRSTTWTATFYRSTSGATALWDYARSGATGSVTPVVATGTKGRNGIALDTSTVGANWAPVEIYGHWVVDDAF